MRPLTVGDPVIIGRYLLLGRLGTGGMGVVYLAEHPRGGLVALKTPHAIHLNDPTLRARFAEEVAFSRRLVPFCTAAVIEDGTDRDRPYLVTEYIPGPALSQVVMARGPLTPDLAYGAGLGVAAALVAVHEAGLVHRDLKPGNVLLSEDGPRVIDFGIARDVDTLGAHTQAGQVMGSPGWVAPERLTGGPAMPASDVFAWGCLVAFAATGHHPFGGGEADVLTRRILFEAPRVEGVPALLRPAVEAALAKAPGDRPKAADLLRVLLAAGGVGHPWDLRAAVAGVLAEIWTPVPYPPGAGRVRLAPETGEGARLAPGTGGGVWPPPGTGSGEEATAAPKRGRRAKAGAHLSHATFAALATVSIAAVTVIAASGGGGGLSIGGASPLPENQPAVQPYETAQSTRRPMATPSSSVPATVAGTAITSPPVSATRARTTAPIIVLDPSPERKTAWHPPATYGPGGPGDTDTGGGCAGPAGKRRGGAARRGCPPPSASITTIPQDGPGESPDPSITPSTSETVTAPATGSS
ncbi:serine/threonine-protein kinase [Nonomuraea aurantiaca]|uniref:serine/threonine-protein kinase n=1 Tax=Nonomuraea aurantiaca TaxID=2878562 RepID=UPI001CD98D63|nr:serine/threonine-protein kinase [Nonomuraea aurantiaca]MCA2226439.1 protein kinase [Nonomuraea aurantiaca]